MSRKNIQIKARGRKKGSTKNVVINDPLIEPYFITNDQYGYTVNERIETIDPDTQKATKRVRPVGYYGNIDVALKHIAEGKLNHNKKTYDSLSEYISEWKSIVDKFESYFNFKK